MFKKINIQPPIDKKKAISEILMVIKKLGYKIVDQDVERPWGGYFRFDEKYGEDFKQKFFTDIKLPRWTKKLSFSPKILFTLPNKRLSWQYHHRRGEVWKMIKGNAGVYLSKTDIQPKNMQIIKQGNILDIPVGNRHRLCGLDTLVIWAEMWMHINPNNPSTESDNIRVSDDFGRKI